MEAWRTVDGESKLPFAKNFQDFLVYQKAYALSLEVHAASVADAFPKYEQYGGIADQMRRASKGICANIAEGHGKAAYPAEWRRFLMMALGSSQEMQVWISYVSHLGYTSVDTCMEWDAGYAEVSKMLKGLIK